MAAFADESGLTINISHFPTGTQCPCLRSASSSE
jgi:hypothetical protein